MIRPYKKSDYEMLCGWLADKKIPPPDRSFFSDAGFVVNENAIGFLFKGGNSRTCYIDHVAANPRVTKEERNVALDALFVHLETIASNEGFNLITVLAERPAMRERFLNHKFQSFRDFTLFFKLLGDT